jgi:hypothetical protein
LTDLNGVLKHWEESGRHAKPHIVKALLGRFKGETGIRYNLLPVRAITPSGLEPRKWIGRVLDFYRTKGESHGPMFRNGVGQKIRNSDLEGKFLRTTGRSTRRKARFNSRRRRCSRRVRNLSLF